MKNNKTIGITEQSGVGHSAQNLSLTPGEVEED